MFSIKSKLSSRGWIPIVSDCEIPDISGSNPKKVIEVAKILQTEINRQRQERFVKNLLFYRCGYDLRLLSQQRELFNRQYGVSVF